MKGGTTRQPGFESGTSRSAGPLIVLFAVAGLALAVGGYGYYHREVRHIGRDKYNNLRAVAEMKTGQIVAWRKERLSDACIHSSGIIRTEVLRWLKAPSDDRLKTEILTSMKMLAEVEGYQNVILAALDGRLLLSLDTHVLELDDETKRLAAQVVAVREAAFGDFVLDPASRQIHLDVAAPILDDAQSPVAALLLCSDPEKALYPLVQSWPTPSESAETLLLRRDGDQVSFLNPLRHSSVPALAMRTPMSRMDAPSVQAARGKTGVFEGRDYRGVAVVADLLAVPDSPWFMVAKMDSREIHAEARQRGGMILLLVALGIVMAGFLAVLLFNHRQRSLYEQLYRAERRQRETQEKMVSRDQAAERAAQAGLREREAFSRSVLDAVGANIAVLDRGGVITAVNDAWERFARENGDPSGGAATGPGVDYLAVVRAATGASSEGAAEALAGIQDVLAGCRPEFTEEYPCHSPEQQRWFMLRATPLAGEEGGAVLAHIDITERWHATQQEHAANLEVRRQLVTAEQSRLALLSMMEDQKRTEEEREQMQAQLVQSQKLESIGTLAGGVAHEINNPVMGIMNYAQLIVDHLGPDNPATEYATEIGKETQRIATIVKNLLSFARVDKETHKSPARMCDIVEDTLSLMRAVMRHDQIALEVDVPADLPEIRCRSQQIRQVIMNLLTNARDALTQKYPGYDANKRVRISARVSDQSSVISDQSSVISRQDTDDCSLITDHSSSSRWLRLTVEDHGPGIPVELRQRMFDPFFTTKPHHKGTGLGLSISHGIVTDHGGKLSVESDVGQWTRFHVDLPVENSDQ